jgi:hypothetical protein
MMFRHWKISTSCHFQNGHHNTAKIQLWRPVEIFQCRDIIIYPHIKFWWYRIMLNFCGIVVAIAQIQHCLISTTFHMWVDYDVPDWFLTSKISTGLHFQNGYHNAAKIQDCSISKVAFDFLKISTGLHFQNGYHNAAKIQDCSISKVAFDLFFKPVVSGRFGRLETS